MNKVFLIGNVVRKPENRVTASGVSFTSFTLAINRNYKKEDGSKDTDFINCVSWRNLADTIYKYCDKGSRIGIEGRLQTRSYDAQDGNKKYVTEVLAENMEFLNTKKETTAENTAKVTENTAEVDPYEALGQEVEITDVDLPF